MSPNLDAGVDRSGEASLISEKAAAPSQDRDSEMKQLRWISLTPFDEKGLGKTK